MITRENEIATTYTEDNDLAFVVLRTSLDQPMIFTKKVNGEVNKKKGLPYWVVDVKGVGCIIEKREEAEILSTNQAGSISVLTYDEVDAEGNKVARVEIKRISSLAQLALRNAGRLKINLLTVDNYTANPAMVATLLGVNSNTLQAVASES